MTDRLYYAEPGLLEFDATVIGVDRRDAHAAVVLDRTAFYPTSGGQPHDLGTLRVVDPDDRGHVIGVVDVVEREDGTIDHVVDGAIEMGSRVRGVIDGARRLDHVQQHSGQHILSAAFDRRYGARTESFHLGAETSTIDLDRELPAEAIAAAETEANDVVLEDRSVAIRFVSAEEAARLPLRKAPVPRDGRLRLIEIERFDLSACGGTHVSRTGMVGLIAIKGWQRFRAGIRVEFVCGRRALDAHRQMRAVVTEVARSLSIGAAEIPDAVRRLQAEGKDARRTLKRLAQKLATAEAVSLAARATDQGGVLLLAEALEDYDTAGLATLASSFVKASGRMVLLVSRTAPIGVVVGRSADVSLDAAAVLRALIDRFGGRGGGRPDFAQGGGLEGGADEILARGREAIAGLLRA